MQFIIPFLLAIKFACNFADIGDAILGEQISYYTLADAAGWTEQGSTSYISWNKYDADLDGYGLCIDGEAAVSRTISTAEQSSMCIAIDGKGYSSEDSGEYCYISYRADASSKWTTVNIIGDTYSTKFDSLISLPDTDEYNDGSFEIEIGNSGQDEVQHCWFRQLAIYSECYDDGSSTWQHQRQLLQDSEEQFQYYMLDDSTGWTQSGSSQITFDSYNSHLGGDGAKIQQGASISRTISTVGYQDIRIVIDVRAWDMESGEDCYLSYSPDGSSWTTKNIFTGSLWDQSGTELDYEIDLSDDSSYNDGSFEIKIGNSGTRTFIGDDTCWFRNLEIYGDPVTPAPTAEPTTEPTLEPTTSPTAAPTAAPVSQEQIVSYELTSSSGWSQVSPSQITFDVDKWFFGDCVRIKQGASISRVISTVGYEKISIEIDVRGADLESGEDCYLSYSADGSSWTTKNIVTASWLGETKEDYTIDLSDDISYDDGSFEIKLGNSGSTAGWLDAKDRCWFKDLVIYGYPTSADSQYQLPGYNNDYNDDIFRDRHYSLMAEYRRNSNHMVILGLMSFITIFGLIAYICVNNKHRARSKYDSVKAVDSEYYDDDDNEVNSSEVPIIQSE